MATSAIEAYAEQVLAGTGLSVADVTGTDTPEEGSAAYALRHGWDLARRAAKISVETK